MDAPTRPRCACGKFMRRVAADLWVCWPCAEDQERAEVRDMQHDHYVEAMRGF
jgi:hypothetical protein